MHDLLVIIINFNYNKKYFKLKKIKETQESRLCKFVRIRQSLETIGTQFQKFFKVSLNI